MDNFSIPQPKHVKRSDYAAAHGISPEAVVTTPPPAPARRPPSWAATCAPLTTAAPRLPEPASTSRCSSTYGTDLADLTTYYKQHRPDQHGARHADLHRRHQHLVPGQEQLRRRRAGARHHAGARHGAGPGRPGDVRRLHRHRHHQRDDHAQPAGAGHRLLVGLDAGRRQHARSVLREDGRAGPELLRRLRRQLDLDEERRGRGLAGRRRLHRLGRRHRPGHGQRRRRVEIGNGVGRLAAAASRRTSSRSRPGSRPPA